MTIIQHWRLPLILFAAIGSALSAGIFFAFSTFVMQALGRQTPSAGIAAMVGLFFISTFASNTSKPFCCVQLSFLPFLNKPYFEASFN